MCLVELGQHVGLIKACEPGLQVEFVDADGAGRANCLEPRHESVEAFVAVDVFEHECVVAVEMT